MCNLQIQAGLLLSKSGAVLSSTLLDTSQAVTFHTTFFYPTAVSFHDRELCMLPGCVVPRPLSMAHDCLFMLSMPLFVGLETIFGARHPHKGLLVRDHSS